MEPAVAEPGWGASSGRGAGLRWLPAAALGALLLAIGAGPARAMAYAVEVSGTDLEFLNPRDCLPDAVNGFGPLGGPRGPGFGLFPFTAPGFEATIPLVPPGRYQIRVIALGPGGGLAGCFGNAITVVVR
jgi:hypothetical protein